MSLVEEIAGWASELDYSNIPSDVLELCRAQRRSVLGAVAASRYDGASARVAEAVVAGAPPGPAPLIGTDGSSSVEAALYLACAYSIALDFDDYICFAHTGHSSVLLPLLLATETGATSEEQLVAQVIANEVGGRLGGACLLGPLNGQMWSFVHAAGAALAAGRMLGLDAARLAHALGLALYQAPRPTSAGFMAPDSKLLTASEPACAGLRAARLAAAGVTGPLDALDHRGGFLKAFSFAPVPGMLGGLGSGWTTSTLSVKRYPGCAYVDTAVDALLQLGPVDPESVARVEVDAGLLTCGMDAMSARYAAGDVTPVTVSFSIPLTVAVVLASGRLTPEELREDRLREHASRIRSLASVVELRHSSELTVAGAASFESVLPRRKLVADVGGRRLLTALKLMRAEHPFRIPPSHYPALLASMRSAGRSSSPAKAFWDPGALARFRMTFPARVRVTTTRGEVLEARADVPKGGAGSDELSPAEAATEKLATFGPWLWGDAGTAAIERAIAEDDDRLPSLLGAAGDTMTPTAGERG